MKHIISLLLILSILSCETKKIAEKSDIESEADQQVAEESPEDILFLVDSTSIGQAGKNKIEIKLYSDGGNILRDIFFYIKRKDWVMMQRIEKDTALMLSDNMEFYDYNNDGFNDLALQPLIAPARGANELKTIYLYNNKKKNLVKLKNADQYPNLAYNHTLKCLDSHAIYGGSTTYFLKIEGDSSRRIADVTLFGKERTITKYDDDGSEYFLLNDALGYEDYVHFNPSTYIVKDFLKEYEELLDK